MGPPFPPAEFFTGELKVNGATSGANVVIGTFWAIAPVVVDKTNQIVDSKGDRTVAPVTCGFVFDPDLIDAPIYHTGF